MRGFVSNMHVQTFMLLLLACTAAAYPYLFAQEYATNCTSHPSKAYGGHGPPQPDPSIVFNVTGADGAPTTQLCPGANYTLEVTWSGGPRMALLTTSSGALEGGLQDIPPGPRNERNLTCLGRAVYPQASGMGSAGRRPSLNTTLTLPCNVTGVSEVQLYITSAMGAAANYMTSSITLPLGNDTTSCPAPAPDSPTCALDAQLAATNASNAQAAARLPGDTAGEEADAGPEGSSVENDADELGATREATGGAPAGGSGGAGGQQLPGTAADQAAPLGGPATDAGRRLRGAMAVA